MGYFKCGSETELFDKFIKRMNKPRLPVKLTLSVKANLLNDKAMKSVFQSCNFKLA